MKTALILGAAAVGAYLLLKYMQGAGGMTIGSSSAGAPAASGITGPTAAGTTAGAQMTTGAAGNTLTGGTSVLGGILRARVGTVGGLPPVSFSPRSPGVSINQVPPPSTPEVTSITNPTPPIRVNPSTGLVPLARTRMF